jgi:hypothetical protein
MKATHNPYNPGAGVPPPELAGRDNLVEIARVAIARAKGGRPAKSAIMLGLRGVGKTVLLNAFEAIAEEEGCQTALLEIDPGTPLAQQLAPQLQHILHRLDRVKKAGNEVQKAFGALRSFASMFKATVGDVDFGFAVTPATGDLSIDLTDLFVAIAEAAKKRDTAVILLIDEIQYLQKDDLSALIMAMHKIAQRQLPLLLVRRRPATAGEACRRRKIIRRALVRLSADRPARRSWRAARPLRPRGARRREVRKGRARLRHRANRALPVLPASVGFALLGRGAEVADHFGRRKRASETAIAALDEGIFKVRFARLTERQKAYARAMAEFGAEPVNSSDVANAMKLSLSQAAPIRDELIKKGMAYSPERGLIGFTVPKFDEYMRRAMPATKRKAAKT